MSKPRGQEPGLPKNTESMTATRRRVSVINCDQCKQQGWMIRIEEGLGSMHTLIRTCEMDVSQLKENAVEVEWGWRQRMRAEIVEVDLQILHLI